jgi:hypothetical protein
LALNRLWDDSRKSNQLTGKQYQNYIRNGFQKGNILFVSPRKQKDLEQLHLAKIESATLCYNGCPFRPFDHVVKNRVIKEQIDLSSGYILHIGGINIIKTEKRSSGNL